VSEEASRSVDVRHEHLVYVGLPRNEIPVAEYDLELHVHLCDPILLGLVYGTRQDNRRLG
jgi:hypothetical protein